MSRDIMLASMQETVILKKTQKEEYLDIDDDLVKLENSTDIIRMETNVVEYPLFSKNTKRKINEKVSYFFKSDKSSYLCVEPLDGFAIPGDFEERVFIALTKIMKKNNYAQTFYVSANEIMENLNLSNNIYYKKIKNAMDVLSSTSYVFKDSFRINFDKEKINSEEENIDDLIRTTIMSMRRISRRDNEADNVLQFDDNRVKEIYRVSFNDYFYNNIIEKGYLAFDSEKLLLINNSVTRAIYIMLEKWRFYNLYFTRPAFLIARRIPLRWDKKNVKRTIDIIERSLKELKEMNLVKDYKIVKETKWELAKVHVYFGEEHNKLKEQTFFEEREEFNEVFITHTEFVESSKKESLSLDNVDTILNSLPKQVQAMKTIKKTIVDYLSEYQYDYIVNTIEYVRLQKPKKSFVGYLKDALKGNWADEYIANKKVHSERVVKKKEKVEVIEEPAVTNKYSYLDFEKYSQEFQEEISDKVYQSFLNEAGAKDNKTMRGIFEKSKKSLIVKYINENEISNAEIEKVTLIEEISNTEIEKTPLAENEIVAEYVTITKFLLEVSRIMKNKNVKIDLEDVATILKIYGEVEDETMKISYDVESKIGIIKIF